MSRASRFRGSLLTRLRIRTSGPHHL